jgi:hypothetical protein
LQCGQRVSGIRFAGSSYTFPIESPAGPRLSSCFKCQCTVTVSLPTFVTTPCSDGGFSRRVTVDPTDGFILIGPTFAGFAATRSYRIMMVSREGLTALERAMLRLVMELKYCIDGLRFRMRLHEIHTNERKYPSSTFLPAAEEALAVWNQHLKTCKCVSCCMGSGLCKAAGLRV